jgi:integrase
VIEPAFKVVAEIVETNNGKAPLAWHGWHAFRRGLATNLKRLHIEDKTIQAILRHGDLNTTMNVYVQSVSEDAVQAMAQFAGSLKLDEAAPIQ